MTDNVTKDGNAGKPIGPIEWARIRACCRACEGIPTEALDAGVVADMLALLIDLVDIEGPMPGTSEWGDKARAAIAKAEGRG